MSKKSPKLPDYAMPDPLEIIEKEAQVNRYDVHNPYGSAEWERDPATGTYKQRVNYSPELQGIFDQQLSRTMAGTNKNPFQAFSSMTGETGNAIAGGMINRVLDQFGDQEGKSTKAPASGGSTPASLKPDAGKENPNQMGPPKPDNYDERKLAEALRESKSGPAPDWMNRYGQLDAKNFRDANGGDGMFSKKMGSAF